MTIRRQNTDIFGNIFPDDLITKVWVKGQIVSTHDMNFYRKDKCGYWIQFSAYGNTNSDYGWEIDHINPVSNGGGDNIANLQPLYWKNNRSKGNTLNWKC